LNKLDVNDFAKLLDSLPAIQALVIGLGSEIFLYDKWAEILSEIGLRRIPDVFLGTNGVLLDEEKIDKILDSNIARVEISLDAATSQTYSKIRGKDLLDVVEKNVNYLLEKRNASGKKLPLIRLCFVVQELNKSEVKDFASKWKSKVDYIGFQQLQDTSRVSQYQGRDLEYWLHEERLEERIAETDKLNEKLKSVDPNGQGAFCSYPFNSLNVWSNGDITPCCCFFGKALKIGNIKDTGLQQAWRSDQLRSLREQFQNGALNRVCRDCLDREGMHREAVTELKDNY
jgi:radical SAM protein with 4Fe4S-binding SPASM domain